MVFARLNQVRSLQDMADYRENFLVLDTTLQRTLYLDHTLHIYHELILK